MSERDQYPAGVPCWVETLQPDPQAALDFYGPLFDWEFAGPGPVPGDPPGKYFVARVRGRDVAGIGSIVDRSGQQLQQQPVQRAGHWARRQPARRLGELQQRRERERQPQPDAAVVVRRRRGDVLGPGQGG